MESRNIRLIVSLGFLMAAALVFIVSDIALAQQDRRITLKKDGANAAVGSERRVALVIGNSAYKSSPLRNPVNDAGDIATTLRILGFDVIHKKNASQRATKALFEFLDGVLMKEGRDD